MVVIEINDSDTPPSSKKNVPEKERPRYSFKNVSYDLTTCRTRATKISVFPTDGSLRGIAESCAASYIQSIWRGCSYSLRAKADNLSASATSLETMAQREKSPKALETSKRDISYDIVSNEVKDEFDDEKEQINIDGMNCSTSLIEGSSSPPAVHHIPVVAFVTPEPQVPYPDGVNRRSKRRDVIKTGCINAFANWTESAIELEHTELMALWHLHEKPSPAVKKRYEASLLGYDSKMIGERRYHKKKSLKYSFPLDKDNLSCVQQVVIAALQNDRSRKQHVQRKRRNSVTLQTAASVQRALLNYLKLPVDAALFLMKYKKVKSYSKSQILTFFAMLGSLDTRIMNKFNIKRSQQIPERDLKRIHPAVLRQRTRIALDVIYFVSRWELALSSDRRRECKTPNKENVPTKEQNLIDTRAVPERRNLRSKPLSNANRRAPLVMSRVNIFVPFEPMAEEDVRYVRAAANTSTSDNGAIQKKKIKKGSTTTRNRNQHKKLQPRSTQNQGVMKDFKFAAATPSAPSLSNGANTIARATTKSVDFSRVDWKLECQEECHETKRKTSDPSSETKLFDSCIDGFSEPSTNGAEAKFDYSASSQWLFSRSSNRAQETKCDYYPATLYSTQRSSCPINEYPERARQGSNPHYNFDDAERNALTSEARLNMILERLRQRANAAGH